MKELYNKFKQNTGINKILYQTFIKIKPFWVVHKKLNQKDTCLCTIHANFKFKLDKLRLLKIIRTNSISQVLKQTTCKTEKYKLDCMYRKCKECPLKISDSFLLVDNSFDDYNIFYFKWTDKLEETKSKKSDKMIKVKRTVNEKVLCSATELLEETNNPVKYVVAYVFNMSHQHNKFKDWKLN